MVVVGDDSGAVMAVVRWTVVVPRRGAEQWWCREVVWPSWWRGMTRWGWNGSGAMEWRHCRGDGDGGGTGGGG